MELKEEKETAETDTGNGLEIEEESQRKPKKERSCETKSEKQLIPRTERIDETARNNDIGSQRQKEWTKERERTKA